MADMTLTRHAPAYQAFTLLRTGFVLLPLLAGIDKFTNVLTTWTKYLDPMLVNLVNVRSATFMKGVGVVEILAAILVAVKPKVGGWFVAVWMFFIIINLLILGGYYDIALRDLGLAIGAVALARLAEAYEGVGSVGYRSS